MYDFFFFFIWWHIHYNNFNLILKNFKRNFKLLLYTKKIMHDFINCKEEKKYIFAEEEIFF